MINGVLLDVGGVVAIGANLIPGAANAVDRLRSAGLQVRFLTSITRQSHRNVVGSLNRMGIAASPDEVVTPSIAARDWLVRTGRTPYLLVHPDLIEDFSGIAEKNGIALVLGDVGDELNYVALNRAYRVLANGADFIALAQNRAFRDEDGQLSLDAGAFVAALEFATRKRAIVLGKPAPAFFQIALDSMGCTPENAAMVGDDAEVITAPKPIAIVDDIASAVDWILDHRPM